MREIGGLLLLRLIGRRRGGGRRTDLLGIGLVMWGLGQMRRIRLRHHRRRAIARWNGRRLLWVGEFCLRCLEKKYFFVKLIDDLLLGTTGILQLYNDQLLFTKFLRQVLGELSLLSYGYQ